MMLFGHFLRNQRGAAAAEMVLVLPLVLALLFTGLEGAHYFYVEHQVVKGVRDGARFASRLPFANFTCGTVSASAQTGIKEVTRTGQVSGGTPRVSGWTAGTIAVSASCVALDTGIYKGMVNAPRVTVSATVPYTSLFGSLTGLDVDINVHAAHQAPVMGV